MHKFLLAVLLAAFLVSCDDSIEKDTLEANQFYAKNLSTESFYKVTAEILAEGKKCVIWAERGSGVTREKAQEIADEYDDKIRGKIVDAFGMKNFDANGSHFDDILDYANWLAGRNNRKLTVLLLDIKDGYPSTNAYVAGYFYSGNFNPRNQQYSNGCDMIYIDTYPGLNRPPDKVYMTYMTFAHELQHLINYATATLTGRHPMDTWIDEGLSSQAEHIYKGIPIEDKCYHFIYDPYKTIAQGNNFFVWGNYPGESILDEYATVYLFFRWLYLQADSGLQSSIFLDIEISKLSNHEIITTVARKIRSEWADWETLLRSWLAANKFPKNTDYGYKDSFFQDKINVKSPPTTTKISLYPGEGVYSKINNSFTPPAGGANIHYAGISESSGIDTSAPYSGDILLTFNANTNNKSVSETGSLTGVSAGISPVKSPMAADAEQTETHSGPFVIDARDYPGWIGISK